MPPPNNRFSKAVVLSSLIGLGAGAAVGYKLKAKPEVSPPAAASPVVISPPAKAAAPAAPYDLQLVVKGGFQPLADFEAWLAAASCGEVSRLLLDPPLNGHPFNSPMYALVVQRFREFSVEDRFNWLQKHLAEKKKIQNPGLLDILSDLARDTLPQRAAEMRELFKLGNQLKPHSIVAGLSDWAVKDFAAAAAFAGQIEGHGTEQIVASLIGGLADRDLTLAQQEALKMDKGQEEAVRSVAFRMGRKDLAAALDWLNANGQTGRGRYGSGGAYQSAIMAAGGVDSAAVAQLIVDRPGLFEGDGGTGLVGEVFKNWAANDPAAAAWLATHPLPELHHEAALQQVEQVRQANLPLDAAMAEVRSLPPEERTERVDLLADRLMADDPASAMARFASMLPEEGLSATVAEKLMQGLPEEFLAQAVRQFPGVLEGLNENGTLAHRLSQLAAGSLADLLLHLPEKARDVLQQQVLQNVLSSDPERALQMAEGMKKEALDPFAGSSIAVHLAASDPQKAVSWVNSFPEGPNREWAAQNLVANWAKYDPDAATAWLETLPPGGSRDRATLETAKIQGATGNHESALALAAGVGDPKARAEATGFAVQRLWNRDPAAAAAALSGSGLAVEQQAALEKKLKQGGFSY